MKRFKRSGFGVTVAVITALMAAYLSVVTTDTLVRLRGRMLCGNHLNSIYDQFNLAVFFVVIALVGCYIAYRSNYGGAVARCTTVAAITAWVVCQLALGIR